ncbi:MAG TPA: hypothetical protein VK536_04315 [Candidatus Limnocylindrales bacterium]|nr:hypothetical protein [Candidatus Limnocylindrales bacterium]
MAKRLEKYAGSLRFWVLIVACTYFAYSVYYAASGMRDSIGMLTNQYIYTSLVHNPWWWLVLFYGSEGVSGSIAILSRAVAGVFAVYAAFLFWRKKDDNAPALRKSAGWALLLENVFFLALIPSVIAAAAYNSTTQNLFYFGHTPGILIIYGTLIPCLAVVLVVPPLLFKLRAVVKNAASNQEVVKWACLTGVGYLFIVFWFTYTMLWAGETVPYTRVYEQWGLSFLLQPANFVSFCLTVFGLLALAIATLIITLPAIKKREIEPNLTYVGAILVAFASYFIFNLFYYYLTGTYSAHPSVWYEVIGPLHNPNLWAVALILLGVPLMVYGKIKKEIEAKTK